MNFPYTANNGGELVNATLVYLSYMQELAKKAGDNSFARLVEKAGIQLLAVINKV